MLVLSSVCLCALLPLWGGVCLQKGVVGGRAHTATLRLSLALCTPPCVRECPEQQPAHVFVHRARFWTQDRCEGDGGCGSSWSLENNHSLSGPVDCWSATVGVLAECTSHWQAVQAAGESLGAYCSPGGHLHRIVGLAVSCCCVRRPAESRRGALSTLS
jgi:hypothetical protein